MQFVMAFSSPYLHSAPLNYGSAVMSGSKIQSDTVIKVDIGITLGYYSFIKAGRFMQPSSSPPSATRCQS